MENKIIQNFLKLIALALAPAVVCLSAENVFAQCGPAMPVCIAGNATVPVQAQVPYNGYSMCAQVQPKTIHPSYGPDVGIVYLAVPSANPRDFGHFLFAPTSGARSFMNTAYSTNYIMPAPYKPGDHFAGLYGDEIFTLTSCPGPSVPPVSAWIAPSDGLADPGGMPGLSTGSWGPGFAPSSGSDPTIGSSSGANPSSAASNPNSSPPSGTTAPMPGPVPAGPNDTVMAPPPEPAPYDSSSASADGGGDGGADGDGG